MKRIAVFTSGGDAPGMNAHVRAVVRTAIDRGVECYGIVGGYQGMIEGNFRPLRRKDTVNIVSQGGTILKTSRSEEFRTPEGRAKAAEQLKQHEIDGIVACGGDGTFNGAHLLHLEHGIHIVGTPGTIDNDLFGTYYTIGYDTAINTAAEAIDRIRDTADSHGRVFIIEVMGRHAGHIAMDVGIACGAEYIAVPEKNDPIDKLYEKIQEMGSNTRQIVIIGEGGTFGGANELGQILKKNYGLDSKATVLGHIQRGGSPTVKDRVLASHLGMAAVDALLSGKTDVMVGRIYHEITYTPLPATWANKKQIQPYLNQMAELLA
ncbi:MAG: 6-phosphofructokinase [Candidatus Kapaibacteriales bacterium]